MATAKSSGSNEHQKAGHSASQNEVQQGDEIKNKMPLKEHIGRQQKHPQPDQSQEQNLSDIIHENENKTTSNGNNGQQQTDPKSDRFQEQDLSDKILEITEDEEMRMKLIKELDTLRKQFKALDEENKKLQDELSRKEITILHLRGDIERRPERPKSAYPTDHRDKSHENENKTTSNGNNGQQQTVPKSDRSQEQDLSDKLPEISEDEERRMKRIKELDTLRGQLRALDEENKKLQDELSKKEITILQFRDDIERRPERPKSAYPTDHREKGRPERPKSAYPIDHRVQRHSQEEMQMKINEQQSHIVRLTTLKEQNKEECERHCNEMDALKGKLKHCEQIITSLKEDKLKNEKTIIELRDANNELLNRLSKIASDRLTHENTDITDLSDETRPSKLTEKMSELYDNQWTRAFDEMKTNRVEDEEAIGILLKIVMETNHVCKTMTFSHYQKLKQASTCFEYSSSSDAENKEKGKIITTSNISIEMKQDIKRIWRESSKKVLKQVIPIIRERVAAKFEIQLMHLTQTPLYMEECAELCWMMNIQEKPMHLDINVPDKDGHKYFDTEKFRSYTKTGHHVAFVVWPALYLFEGGSLLKKGVAQGLKIEKGTSSQ